MRIFAKYWLRALWGVGGAAIGYAFYYDVTKAGGFSWDDPEELMAPYWPQIAVADRLYTAAWIILGVAVTGWLVRSLLRCRAHMLNPIARAGTLGSLLATLMKLYSLTWRIRVVNEAGLSKDTPGAVIWAFWHNRLLPMPVLYSRCLKRMRPTAVLTSPSKDGAIVAAVVARFGLESVRGSSNKRAAQALVECRRRLRDGCDIGITPDGPRGPCYQIAPGVIQLARVTGCPVLPVRITFSRAWRLNSWDRFQIPKPFARVTITLLPLEHFAEGEISDAAAALTRLLVAED
jgi:lysophospholipid acyltransferase (LPLAT)-like uncharacterized protein